VCTNRCDIANPLTARSYPLGVFPDRCYRLSGRGAGDFTCVECFTQVHISNTACAGIAMI
jgi:hypothetical protein